MNKLICFLCFIFFIPIASATASCNISSISGVNFGNYNPLSFVVDNSAGSMTITCTNNIFAQAKANPDVTIELSKGQSTTYSPRIMNNGTQLLHYNLYVDAGRTKIWGDGTGETSVVTEHDCGSATVTVYGQISNGQNVKIGNYSDTITVTINF
jgi:spore coat protein U-like protein